MNKIAILGGLGVAAFLASRSSSAEGHDGNSWVTGEEGEALEATPESFEDPAAVVDAVTGAIDLAQDLMDAWGVGDHQVTIDGEDDDPRDIITIEEDGTVTAPEWSAPVDLDTIAFHIRAKREYVRRGTVAAGATMALLESDLHDLYYDKSGFFYVGPTNSQIGLAGLYPTHGGPHCDGIRRSDGSYQYDGRGLASSIFGIRNEAEWNAAREADHPIPNGCGPLDSGGAWAHWAGILDLQAHNESREARGFRPHTQAEMIRSYLNKG